MLDGLGMLDEALRLRIDPDGPHAGVGIERVGVCAEPLTDVVLPAETKVSDAIAAAKVLLGDDKAKAAVENTTNLSWAQIIMSLPPRKAKTIQATDECSAKGGGREGGVPCRMVIAASGSLADGQMGLGSPERRPGAGRFCGPVARSAE